MSNLFQDGANAAGNAFTPWSDLWTRVKIAVMPESTAEAAVHDFMHSDAGKVWIAEDAGYDTADYSQPNVYTKGKAELVSVAQKGFAGVALLLLAAVAVYAAVGLLGRR